MTLTTTQDGLRIEQGTTSFVVTNHLDLLTWLEANEETETIKVTIHPEHIHWLPLIRTALDQ